MLNEKTIINSVSAWLLVPADNILSKSRRQSYADARAVYAYLLRRLLRYTYQHIGDILGRRHSSVMHMVSNVQQWLDAPYINPDCATATRAIVNRYSPDL